MKGSLIIISFFIIGLLISHYGFTPDWLIEKDYSTYVLMALMFCVGITVGKDSRVMQALRKDGFKMLILPLATIIGTLSGVAIASLILSPYTLWDCMAVGSGFGYYSLSSIFITEYKGAELGTVALISNILREIITLLFAPLLVVVFGKLAPIAAGGATSEDTTLPIISSVSGSEFIVIAIIHGIVIDFTVPFLVTFFCTL